MRSLSVVLLSLLLAGCPAYFSAVVKNQSNDNIVMTNYKSSSKITIEPGSEKEVSWGFNCQSIILTNGSVIHFIPGRLREETYVTSGPVTTFKILFKEDHLFYVTTAGDLIPIREASSC